jgi:hypothetical protein
LTNWRLQNNNGLKQQKPSIKFDGFNFMRKFNLFIIICFGLLFSVNSQILVTNSVLHRINDSARVDEGRIDFLDPNTYIGSPYEFPEFQRGGIYTKDSLFIGDLFLRYNVVANKIEIKKNSTDSDEDIKYLSQSLDLHAKIEGRKFVFIPLDGNMEEGDYFEVIYEGSQVDLYMKHEKEIRPVTKASSSITREMLPKFRDKPLYFLVTKRKKFYQFPKSRNDKYKVFGSKSEEMKKYAKSERLNINEEEDLIKVVQYFEKQ